MKKETLIAYFKLKGRKTATDCENVAKEIAKDLSSKNVAFREYVIEPVEIYPEDPKMLEGIAKLEKKDKLRPALTSRCGEMQDIDKIILVAPNWFDDLPMAVYSFFDSRAFNEKKIVPVICHGGDGAKNIVRAMRAFLNFTDVAEAVEVENGTITPAQLEKVEEELNRP